MRGVYCRGYKGWGCAHTIFTSWCANMSECPSGLAHALSWVPLDDPSDALRSWLSFAHTCCAALSPLAALPDRIQLFSISLLFHWLRELSRSCHRWSPSSQPTPPLLGTSTAYFLWITDISPTNNLFPGDARLSYIPSPAGHYLGSAPPSHQVIIGLTAMGGAHSPSSSLMGVKTACSPSLCAGTHHSCRLAHRGHALLGAGCCSMIRCCGVRLLFGPSQVWDALCAGLHRPKSPVELLCTTNHCTPLSLWMRSSPYAKFPVCVSCQSTALA